MAVVRNNPRSQHVEVYSLENGRNHLLAQKLQRYLVATRVDSDSWGRKYGDGLLSDSWVLVAGALDFIRPTNVQDPWLSPPARFVPEVFPVAGTGQVTPLHFSGGDEVHAVTWTFGTRPLPRGYGRFPTVSEVALVIGLRHRTLAGETPTGFYGDNQTAASTLGSGLNHYEIEVALLIEGFVPAHATTGPSPRMSLTLGGYGGFLSSNLSQTRGESFDVGNITVNGRPLVFPVSAAARSTASTPRMGDPTTSRWIGGGGGLGVRFMRDIIAFTPILFSEYPGSPAPSLNFSGTPIHPDRSHLRLIVRNVDSAFPADGAVEATNIIQSIPLAFPEIRNDPTLPFDDPTPVAFRDCVGNRMERARTSGDLLGPDGLIHGPPRRSPSSGWFPKGQLWKT